jgi:hypothetical protein
MYFNFSLIADKIEARHFIDEDKDHESLSIIKIPIGEYNKSNENEIWYDGKLYDIASSRVENGFVYLSVWHDGDEETLVNNYTAQLRDNGFVTDVGTHVKSVQKTFIADDNFFQPPFRYLDHSVVIDLDFTLFRLSYFDTNYSSVLSPPPDSFLI